MANDTRLAHRQANDDNMEFTVKVSFIEIHNQDINDLLIPPKSSKKPRKCTYIK